MPLPFTPEQFFNVFGEYNTGVWPAQLVLIALGLVAAVFTLRQQYPRLVLGVLSLLWLWMGVVYHYLYFSEINGAAIFFAAIFVLQGVYFALFAAGQGPRFDSSDGWYRPTSLAMLIYAFLLYPLTGFLLGQDWPRLPSFGVPCPTTIFTMAILLRFAPGSMNRTVALVPILWAVIATSAAITLGVGEDFALPISGVILLARLLVRRAPRLAGT